MLKKKSWINHINVYEIFIYILSDDQSIMLLILIIFKIKNS